jgi:5-methylcytosine-specific restriction protein A
MRIYDRRRWHQQVRKQALLDGNYRCTHCGADLTYGGKLAHVHHVIPVKDAPELAFDLFNVEPLCTHCHNKAHGRGVYGCDVHGTPLDPNHPWNAG